MKPTLKPPGTKRLKLKDDELVSNFALKFKLRRYIVGIAWSPFDGTLMTTGRAVQVDPMKPKLKPPGTKRLKLEYD
jgi:hypothetical protein